jgi:ComF family protein
MPLHKEGLSQRGFNQVIEIARPLAKKLQIPMSINAVQRIKKTLPQSTLSAAERAKNVKAAFNSEQRFDGLRVAIVDDVITTGQTARAVAAVLKAKGAQSVHVWACARSAIDPAGE